MSKGIKLYGRDIIAVDESNNGFQEHGVPMIIAAYCMPNYSRAHAGNEPFEKKKFAYAKHSKKQRIDFIRRAKEFFLRNPKFVYTTYSKELLEKHGLDGWAKAISSVVLETIDVNSLQNPAIIMHRIDDKSRTTHIKKELSCLLNDVGLNLDIQARGDGNKNRGIRKADRSAYNVAGLRLLKTTIRWPYRSKKVPWNSYNNFNFRHLANIEEADLIEQKLLKRA